MKYCVAVLLAAAEVLDATLEVLDVATDDDEVVWTDDVVVVVAFTEVVELVAVAVAGIHWSRNRELRY